MLDDINEQIKELTEYGMRHVKILKSYPNFTILNWSNGSKEWYTHHTDITKQYKKGDVLNLDANQLIVPFKRSKVLEIINQLNNLPLFKNSTEARSKISN